MVRVLLLRASVALGLWAGLGNCPAAIGQLIAYDGFEDLPYIEGNPDFDRLELQLTGSSDDYGNPLVTPGWTGETSAEHATTRKWYQNYSANSYLFVLDSLQNSAVDYDDSSTGKVEFEAYDSPGIHNFRSITRAMDA